MEIKKNMTNVFIYPISSLCFSGKSVVSWFTPLLAATEKFEHPLKEVTTSPEVPNPTAEVEAAVPEADESVPAEEDRLCTHRRLGELGEDDASHACLPNI